jgi:threonine dehydratase
VEITREAIAEAAARIAPYVRLTPVLALENGALGVPGRLVLKLESLQPTGTFKVRGAYNLLLSREPGKVVAASGGNFALAVSRAAARLGVEAVVFVPDSSPPEKVRLIEAEGADIRVVPGFYENALQASRRHVVEHGGLLAHAYDQPEVVAGAGTCGMEIMAQVPEATAVLAGVGGGGLIGGIASAVRNAARVVAVETEGTPTLHAARAAGHPVDVEVSGLAVSSLGAGRIGELAWEANRWIAGSLLVTDQAVIAAQRLLWQECRLVAEPGGATALAGLSSGAYEPAEGETVVVVVSGANGISPFS